MNATKIRISGAEFLLPDTHSDYEFPTYIMEHRSEIQQKIAGAKMMLKNPMSYEQLVDIPDMTEFKQKTGIIGWPFDMRDVNLYELDRCINITMTINLDRE
ncbi:hypothetical protein [Oceanobacter antarcticus]|uniref:Phage protein n=1 Tax=Oceanobacter antarcticus TaxID=3133425 RepID=A0ABW8NES3_9GAMM